MDESTHVDGVAVSKGAEAMFAEVNGKTWITRSQLIESALLPALLWNSEVTVELVSESNEIKRVNPYAVIRNSTHLRGAYSLLRIATQRNAKTREDRLEVVLKKDNDPEMTFNVFDPLIQTIFIAFADFHDSRVREQPGLEFEAKDGEVVAVVLGRNPKPLR